MITENIEAEYKVMVSEADFQKLLSLYPGEEVIEQTNHYFSSKSSPLLYFRMREIRGSWLFTLKDRRPDGSRTEYEKALPSCFLEDPEILSLLAAHQCLPPFYEAASMKTIRHLTVLPDEAELCLDENTYGARKDFEVEYEIKGKKGSVLRFQKLLQNASVPYRPSPFSKQKRALDESFLHSPDPDGSGK